MDAIKTDMSTVLNSMTSWWGTSPTEQSDPKTADSQTTMAPGPGSEKKDKDSEPSSDSTLSSPDPDTKKEDGTASDNKSTELPKTDAESSEKSVDVDIEEMSAKAVETAKEWGSYLYTFGKSATVQVSEQVVKTAKQFKDTIDDKTMIGDFNKEQKQFVTENTEKKKKSEAGVPPWVGYNEEEAMKTQILSLSSDKRNFLRNPPAGVQFNFDFEASFPVAASMLQEDPKLVKMRFELVPKQVKEDIFWRNYLYRVSLIKQSAQLTSLAQQTGTAGDMSRSGSNKSDSPVKGAGNKSKEDEKEVEEFTPSSPAENEFASDAFQENEIDEEDIKKEMQQLGMSDKEDDMPEWEQELQAELQEYEVVDDGNGLDDDDDLEQEILDQLEAESNSK